MRLWLISNHSELWESGSSVWRQNLARKLFFIINLPLNRSLCPNDIDYWITPPMTSPHILSRLYCYPKVVPPIETLLYCYSIIVPHLAFVRLLHSFPPHNSSLMLFTYQKFNDMLMNVGKYPEYVSQMVRNLIKNIPGTFVGNILL